ncbi:cupin domain-containing protein [Williamsia maris]|nr:cupin domain-containing protein [Williamsia maris]
MSITPDAIAWEHEHPDGTRSATLVGVREAGNIFTYAFYIPPNVWDAPHSHPTASHLTVASGTLLLGYGPIMKPGAAVRHPAGSFLHVPAGAVHFDGADEETVIIGTAIGAWSTDYV